MVNEAKETTPQTVRDDGEGIIDSALDGAFGGQETPEETSTSEQTTDTETDETEETGTDQTKPDDSKEDAEDVPKEFHKNPAWQRIKGQRDEARQKLEELSADFESKLAEFNKVTSSPSFIRTKMEAEGYKPEVIDETLRKAGHTVPPKTTDDVDLVLTKLGIDKGNLTQEQKDYINVYVADAAKVADVIFQDRLAKVLPQMIDPLQKSVAEMTQKTTANQLVTEMKKVVADEGVLDFTKDIEPGLDEYMKKNPTAMQEDVFTYFKELNHRLSLERLRTGERKTERDKTKPGLRGNKPGAPNKPGALPGFDGSKTDSENIDVILNAAGL